MTISDVSCDGYRYTVFDEDSREVNGLYVSSFGELLGFGEDFLIFQNDNKYVIVNAENGNEITSLYVSSTGRFKHANGRLIVFKNDNRLVTYTVGYSGISETSNRYV